MSTIRRTTLLAAALVAAGGTGIALESTAQADVRIRIGGSAHVRVGGRARVHRTRVHYRVRRPAPPRLRVQVGGAIWVGGSYRSPRYSEPPPPPVSCDCDNDYYPVVPAESSTAVYVAPVRPRLPRWGIGVAAGGVDVQGESAGDDLALLGRLRLTKGLLLEGEVGKSELADGMRVDRRLGASLVYELGAYNRWAPYVVGGLGVTQVEVGDDAYETSQNFAEIGVGLRLAVTPRVHLAADVRAGSRSASDEAQPIEAQYRMVTPEEAETEEYTRGRLSAVLYF